jgi:hypothetical protein
MHRSPYSALSGARLFEPDDRLITTRLQQVYDPNPFIPDVDVGIAARRA